MRRWDIIYNWTYIINLISSENNKFGGRDGTLQGCGRRVVGVLRGHRHHSAAVGLSDMPSRRGGAVVFGGGQEMVRRDLRRLLGVWRAPLLCRSCSFGALLPMASCNCLCLCHGYEQVLVHHHRSHLWRLRFQYLGT